MNEKKIGKIKKVSFGLGGYQDAQIGVSFSLGSDKESWGVCDFWGQWATECTDSCKWTEADRETELGKTCMKILKLLEQAKVYDLQQLQGVPVEVEFEDTRLKSWRILEEVI